MTRQYTRRDAATQTDDGDTKAEETVTDTKATDTSADTKADDKGDNGDEGTDASKAPAKTVKPRSRTQIAREKAAAMAKAQESVVLESSPQWQVIYPTGISLHRPDEDEIVVDVNGSDTDVEVIDEFAHVPMNGRVRAASIVELSRFADLASQGMLRQVLDPTL